MKNFTKGFLSGAAVLGAGVAAALYGVKKTVIEPVEKKEEFVNENRKKAMRKSHARS
ncbi:DUF3042 family protein [Catellicoccus marimammalium]|uniref:DUF3042 domain-containing protein n=1 Tax=Catellicoccus marimammalium M35/04/3 TaxID=1234409 RepID=K8Z9W8_9ENTE|nr:DUF3042 family protein [Catellicoccus marimammalium]EKU26862.1 hypothetical protein C683_1137 [Catellicoccus marimammalium M35/04/3]